MGCQSINQASLDWAVANAGKEALTRFSSKGQPYKIVPDTWAPIGLTGPEWIDMAMIYKPTVDKKQVEISAPYSSTVGYHYCKLLSPAKVMEWIYVDGLRQFG